MDEKDLKLARAIVEAEKAEKSENLVNGSTHSKCSTKKSLTESAKEKLKAFR